MKTTTTLIFVVIVALGAAAITTAVSFVDQVNASNNAGGSNKKHSCNPETLKGDPCHGCKAGTTGFDNSRDHGEKTRNCRHAG